MSELASWTRQSAGRGRFGVSGTGWFLCDLKTTAQLRWGLDGARISLSQGGPDPGRGMLAWAGHGWHGWLQNRRVDHNASRRASLPPVPLQGSSSYRAQTAPMGWKTVYCT